MSEQQPPAEGYLRFDCTADDPVLLDEAIEAAARAVDRGECIVMPTDTVYGIGADAFSPEAVQRLLDAKMRGRDMPPPVLIADNALIRALADDVPQSAKDLVARHWPGPLTIICRAQPSLRMDLGDTEGTIALRVPDHTLAREILRRTGPMAVSSANISGLPAAVTCDQAVEQLAERVAVYLDGGARPWHGEPSTIVDFTQTPAGAVLRRGALSVAVIRETLPDLVDLDEPLPAAAEAEDAESEPALDAEVTAEVAPPDASARDVEPYPTTDDLGITHATTGPDQPSLFEPAGVDGGEPTDATDGKPDSGTGTGA